MKKDEKTWALNPQGFKRVSDDAPVDITKLPDDDKGLYYKDEPYTTKKLHQRLIITYSPKYVFYQKTIRDKRIERAEQLLAAGTTKKNRKNPNDPARFIGTIAVTKDGEAADIQHYLDESKISDETQYDGLYAVCTDLLDDEVGDALHKACGFRTDFQFITRSKMRTIQKKAKVKNKLLDFETITQTAAPLVNTRDSAVYFYLTVKDGSIERLE